jgi:MYXO-CTERM domain-containing protein
MRRLLLFCLASAVLAPVASATVLDFEGLADFAKIPDGYGGFNWSEFFWSLDAFHYELNPSGYGNGLVSGSNVAFSAYASVIGFGLTSGTFTLNGLYLTGAWNNGLNVDIVGYRLGSIVRSTTVIVDATGPTHVVLNWSGLDWVGFQSYGGVRAGYNGTGTHFALDDLDVEVEGAPVPEPFTVALGLGGLALAARRRRR